RRDLTHNEAATDDGSADPALRPIHANLPPAEIALLIEAAAAALPRWKLESKSVSEDSARLAYTRTTPLFRFRDAITLRVEAAHGGSVIHAHSKSRVGRGDLGQNARNLKEVLHAIRARLEKAEAGSRKGNELR